MRGNAARSPGRFASFHPVTVSGTLEYVEPGGQTAPNSAGIWNYWLGGNDYSPVDRAIGEQVQSIFPQIVTVAKQQRAFGGRAVRHLVTEAVMRQFLDLGAGLPVAGSTHQIAQRAAPEAEVVYVDNDPVAASRAKALLAQAHGCAYLEADLSDTASVIAGTRQILDLARPVTVVLLGVLGHVADDDRARSIVRRTMAELAPGSYLVLADGTDTDEVGNRAQAMYNQRSPFPYHLRSPRRVASLFDGLELIEPGVVACPAWRPEPGDRPGQATVYGGVARKA